MDLIYWHFPWIHRKWRQIPVAWYPSSPPQGLTVSNKHSIRYVPFSFSSGYHTYRYVRRAQQLSTWRLQPTICHSMYTSHGIMGLWHFVIHQLNFLNCTVFSTTLCHVILIYVTNILYNNHFLIYIKLCATIVLCCIPRDAIMLSSYNF